MKNVFTGGLLLPALASAACISSGDQNTINSAFQSGGQNAVVQLCPNALIQITDIVKFTADGQELSTQGYPTDSSRATIQVAVGSGASTLISARDLNNIRIKNIQLEGNRQNAGFLSGGDANIIVGGVTSGGQVISNVASRNPRSWSCLHVIGSGQDNNPCRNVTLTNNDIGPCGQSGTDPASGDGLWADGISLDCTASLVQGNTITGSTDGGIVVFGSPGSTVTGNTVKSSSQYLGFGAINLVDDEYDGSYAGVTVTNNNIIGDKLFNIGIGVGANVWSFNDPSALSGPVTITGNTISGQVSFPIAVNGWTNGITVTGNTVSGVTSPKSSFADASQCSQAIQSVFNSNANLIYYPAGISGSQNFQSGFVATPGNATNFLCSSLPLPNSVTFQPGQLTVVSDSGPFATLHNVIAQYQGDNNLVVLQAGSPVWASGHTLPNGGNCGSPSGCQLKFGSDGNFASFFNGVQQWSTNTSGSGKSLVVLNQAPWIQVKDGSGNVIWDTTKNQ
ncbi:uncharacterized protein TrAtP1_005289 [Trichoderma atroviride]|uniref:uncharacterized protein n=1 Tax=Hypocrea atroviridis TaxID=63577 RepID=UPI00332266A4|nr:hypothetical protein TrAtP1_005289 [Trichoderma atroviride]